MSTDTALPAVAKTSSLRMIFSLGLVAMFSGLAVVTVFQTTKPFIAENQRIMVEQAVFKVVRPGASARKDFRVAADGLHEGHDGDGMAFYAAYDDHGALKGIAVEGAAQGYADMVRLLYGYDPACECIVGFSVIKMAETPGLGDKILRDEKFIANFDALDASVAGTDLAHPIVTVKHGTKKNAWEIDAISGATITSTAVGKAVGTSAQALLPKLRPYLQQLQP